jgi:hypothetical protein
MKRVWIALWLATVVVLSGIDALPIPDAQLSVERSDLRDLKHIEAAATRTAQSLSQELHAADHVAGGLSRLGDGRGSSDEDQAEYQRRLHGAQISHNKKHAKDEAALLREELASTQASVRSLEAAAETTLQRDKRVGAVAMNMAVASEHRRENEADAAQKRMTGQLRSAKTATALWKGKESRKLDKVVFNVDKEYKRESDALKVERRMHRSDVNNLDSTLNMPSKQVESDKAVARQLESRLGQLRSSALSLKESLDQTQKLGEPKQVDSSSLDQLRAELQDAQATRKMLLQDAQTTMEAQQSRETRSIQDKLVAMRLKHVKSENEDLGQQISIERSKSQKLQVHTHQKIREMEAVTEQIQKDSAHQFAEFSEILESSHHTKKQADNKLTNLEAMMTALKTSRTMRLMHNEML